MVETNLSNLTAAFGLGSNLGDRLAALRAGVEGLSAFAQIVAKSHIYETAPCYVTDQPAFLNAVVLASTSLNAAALLKSIKTLEDIIGRRPTVRNGPRLIDIDLLFLDAQQIEIPDLTLPHRGIAEREFVLRPLNDVAPNWRNPSNGRTVQAMLKDMQDVSPKFDIEL